MKRASKRLINAIIALVVSVILCIGVCLAWFAMNNNVSGNGMQTQVKSGDIVDFSITAYYLNYENNVYSVTKGNFTLNGKEIEVDYNDDKIINTTSESDGTKKDEMRPYSVSGGYTTAVLFKVDYEIVDGSQKKFRIFAECDEDSRLKVTDEDNDGNFISYLSNTVTFVSATQSATASGTSTFAAGDDTTPDYTYTAGAGSTAFVGGVGLREKSFQINLSEEITTASLGEEKKNAEGNYENTEYFIMDYEKERFTYISSLLLESGGGLNSGLTLTGDITIGIEEYDADEVVTPTSIAVDDKAYNSSTAYKQTMSTVDNMTPNWQFVVTYSDGSQKIIVGKNSNLTISGVVTNQVGTGTATATYTEGGVSIDCSVPYTIGLAITGGSGVAIDKTLQLSASGLGDSATVIWSSSDTSIATVVDGLVTGVAEGKVTITAQASTYVDDNTTPYLKAEYVITVTEKEVAVTGVTLNTSTLALGIGNKATLLATVAPTNATNKAVTWTSSDPTVVTVVDGVVTALKSGETTITVTTQGKGSDGTTTYSASCTVTVSATVPVTSVTISGTTSEIAVDGTTTLSVVVEPETATDKSVSWSIVNGTGSASITSSSNTSCTIKGVSPGTITVYAEAGGKSGSYTITVTGVKLDKTSATLVNGENTTITATVYPMTADQTITWTSDKESVATVDSNGVVTAVGEGTATITATASDGSTATCTITVTAKTYTVTFYDDDGTTVISSPTFNEGATISAPDNPSKTATAQYTYEFEGWYTAASGGEKVTFGSITATTNVSYFARYTATLRQYTVTWKNYDGSTLETDTNVAYGTTPSYDSTEPARAEDAQYTYAFSGWSDGTNSYGKAETLPTVSGDVTYTATFSTTLKQYTVTFVMNGHGTQVDQQTVKYGEKLASFTQPTESGYTFGGWYTDEGLTTSFDVSTDTITSTTTLYAKWTEVSTSTTVAIFARDSSNNPLTLPDWANNLEGSIGYADGNTFTYGSTTYSDPLKLQASTKVTFTLTSEMTVKIQLHSAGSSNVIKINDTEYTADSNYLVTTTLSAGTYVITRVSSQPQLCYIELTPTGGSSATSKYTVTFKNGDTELQTGEVEKDTKPTYSGETPTKDSTAEYTYTFSGWSSDGGTTVYTTENLPAVTADVTYVAQFNEATRKYTVTFMDGSSQLSQSKVNYNDTVTKPDNPEKTGYTFVQWCSDAELTTEFVFTTAITEDTTLYAKWTAIEYSITYMDGETELTGLEPATYTIEDAVNLPTPEKSDYTFDGWYTESTFENQVTTIATGTTGDKTFYAKWTSTSVEYTTGTHTLTFSADADIFTVTKASSDGGYGTASDGTARVKLGTNDYLYITMMLKEGDKIYLSGVARPSDSTRVAKLNISCITGTVTGINADVEYSTTGGVISETITVSETGEIKLQFMRSSTATGCEITNLYVGINQAPTVPVSSVTLSDTTSTMQVGGETLTLTPTIAPLNATNTAVTWSTSDDTVATVVDGVVTAVAAGTATITVTTEEGSYSATCVVTVEAASSGSTVTEYSVDGGTGITTLTSTLKDEVINMAAGTKTGFSEMEDASWEGTINGETKTFTKALRAGGNNRVISVSVTANSTVYVAFGANYKGGKTASIWFGNTTTTAVDLALASETSTYVDSDTKTYSTLLSYTFTETNTYYIIQDSNTPYIYGITIVTPATTS